MAEPLSLAVIDQIAKDGWVEGWQVEVEEEEEEDVKMVEEKVENGVEKVEQGKKEIGGKEKEELGRIPLSVSRYFILWQKLSH